MFDASRPIFGLRAALLGVVVLALALGVIVQGRILSEQGRRIARLEASTRQIRQQNLQVANGMNRGQQAVNQDLRALRKDVETLRGEKVRDAESEGPSER